MRLGSAYFLAFIFFVLAVMLWLRGMGRLLLPLALLCTVAYGVNWFIQKVREPVE
jgi:hypothetical protein